MCGFVLSLCTSYSVIRLFLWDMNSVNNMTTFFKFIMHSFKLFQTAGTIWEQYRQEMEGGGWKSVYARLNL